LKEFDSIYNMGHSEPNANIESRVSNEEKAPHHSRLSTASSRTLVTKQDLRIVPLCAGIYLLCFLDRGNIGNAKVLNEDTGDDLLDETHMSDTQFVIALMLFLIAYGLFEVPSNYMLKRLRPSRWIAFLM
jgi:hypothetical protein